MKPFPVKLVVPCIISKDFPLDKAIIELKNKFSKIDFESETISFNHTDYYYKEMGQPLYRKFYSFKNLVNPGELADIKNTTCRIENKFSINGKRTINLDPGYIEPSKFVLASTKNFYHRIYIGKGIFAEVTLVWRKDNYQILPWTFPDYSTKKYRKILKSIREIYMKQIKQ